MRKATNVPLEEDEQRAFVAWCRLQGIRVHHSGNEIGGSIQAMKTRAIKMKQMGTSKGFPDLLVFVPITGVDDEIDAYQMLAIEMKRLKGSTTTREQKEWGEVLEKAGIPFRVCKGAEKAIEFVEEYRNEEKDVIF